MKTTVRRGIALVLLIMMTACTSMQPVAQPRDFMASRQPSVVWLNKASDNKMMAIEGPRLVGDSIVGFHEGEYTEIALTQISAMQARQYSRKRTAIFAVGAAALVATLFATIQSGHGSTPEDDGEDVIGIRAFQR